jgi:hypothetical protein
MRVVCEKWQLNVPTELFSFVSQLAMQGAWGKKGLNLHSKIK